MTKQDKTSEIEAVQMDGVRLSLEIILKTNLI